MYRANTEFNNWPDTTYNTKSKYPIGYLKTDVGYPSRPYNEFIIQPDTNLPKIKKNARYPVILDI